jgi:hypothetical protein
MVAQVKASKKNSPAVTVGKNRDNLPAEAYAKPHGLAAKPAPEAKGEPLIRGNQLKAYDMNNNTPVPRVSMGLNEEVKSSGIAQRGHGAATKGFTSRGPMA